MEESLSLEEYSSFELSSLLDETVSLSEVSELFLDDLDLLSDDWDSLSDAYSLLVEELGSLLQELYSHLELFYELKSFLNWFASFSLSWYKS